ncbi:MAG: CorA family divalent cation transporter [Polyangiales bacterium]
MKVSCYQLDAGRTLAETSKAEALERWRSGNGTFWIDVSEYDRESLKDLLDEVGVTGFLRQRCLQPIRGTAAFALPRGTFAEWALFLDRKCTKRGHASALCLENLLVTMHVEPIEGTHDMNRAIGFLELERVSTAGVLCVLLLRHGAKTARTTRAIRDRVLELGQLMDEKTDAIDPLELERLKRSVQLTDAVAEEQQEAFELIEQARSIGLEFSNLEAPLRLLRATAGATFRLNERMDGRVENLLRRIQDQKQGLLNQRLGVLTIVSAIFLPLTLLAGIWGMNFEDMPELSDPGGYPMALGLMATLGVGSIWFFYKRGWFG